jgi:hypothetical protein
LFWDTLPLVNNQAPDYTISLPEMGTPRNISTDGSTYFFVGDHNAKVNGNRAGTFFWNSFPTKGNQSFNFYRDEWIKGTKLPDGRLIAAGLSSVYVWNSVPTLSSTDPDFVLRNPWYKNGDGPDVVSAGGRLYINNYNGNNVLVYKGLPTVTTQQADYAVGSSSPQVNTLDSMNYVQNPVVATDGKVLIASSDFDRRISVWKSLPEKSAQAPDLTISLNQLNLSPWDNALYGNAFVCAGKQDVAIWDSLPLRGENPSRVFRKQIGSVSFNELKGIALDSLYLYVADANGSIYIWNKLPVSGSEEPYRTLTIPSTPLNHCSSDGVYLTCAVQGNPASVYIYRVSDISTNTNPQPWKVITSTPSLRLNLPASAITFNGSLAIANTSFNQLLLWPVINDAPDATKAIVLGQPSISSTTSAIGKNRLFMPATLAWDGLHLWVGEVKFSSRVLRFSPSLSTDVTIEKESQMSNTDLELFPQPATRMMKVRYAVKSAGVVRLSLYDHTGCEVHTVFSGIQQEGQHEADIDVKGLSSAVYFCRYTDATHTAQVPILVVH